MEKVFLRPFSDTKNVSYGKLNLDVHETKVQLFTAECAAVKGVPAEVLKYFGDATLVDSIFFGVKPLLEYKVVDGQVELYLLA